jgi:hypothetical protein
MQNAPSVDCPVGRCAFEQRFAWVLWALWVVSQAIWAFYAETLAAAWWIGSAFAGLLLIWQRWQRQHPVEALLRWTGEHWIWFSPAYRRGTPLKQLTCVLDLQRVLLLRVENAAGLSWWVWLEPPVGAAQGLWPAVRRAVRALHR